MSYLPPYRHETRDNVASFAKALNAGYSRPRYKQFKDVLSEIENLVAENRPIGYSAEETYMTILKKCRSDPGEVTDSELAHGIAAATWATKTDILGALYQYTGRTAEDHFNQYFTPPNVADLLARIGHTTREHFKPPTPSKDTVSGKTTLDIFTNDGHTEDESKGESSSDGSQTDEETIIFDPACGSGRLLLAAGRATENPVVLGWDLETDAAHMAALTLTLTKTPGWIIAGDALAMNVRSIYRIAPETNTPLQKFSVSEGEVNEILSSERHDDPPEFDATSALEEEVSDSAEVIEEVESVLQRGVDQVVGNPPFDKRDLNRERYPNDIRTSDQYALARKTFNDETSTTRSSQKTEWLFTELATEFTRDGGVVSLVVPTTVLSIPSDKFGREWLLERGYLDTVIELPEETFQPETSTATSIISFKPKEEAHVGLTVNYEVFMAIAESIGHDSRTTVKQLHEDGEPLTESVDSLPTYYCIHDWRGISEIKLPDDDLITIYCEHREMRSGEDVEEPEIQQDSETEAGAETETETAADQTQPSTPPRESADS